MRVLAAMSGGVDSSVAAAMLVGDGHDVTGVHLKLGPQPAPGEGGRARGCCSVADADDARRVAQVLDIPFYVWDLSAAFASTVVADFVGTYASGRTPNPCVRCNEWIKFGALLDRALRTGFDAVATGHYAVVRTDSGGRRRLFRSPDAAKDQSYVLARLGQRELAHALFPVGGQTKDETRRTARELALRTADKPDSYEICFVPDGDAAAFVGRAAPGAPGQILDEHGTVLGEHGGVHRYTVGQRRGLGLATAERRFVLEIDAARNAIVVGPESLLARGGLEAGEVSWVAGEPPAGIDAVQVRAHGVPIPSTLLEAAGDRAIVRFARAEPAIAPGQLVAFLRGDEVLGGGTIARATR